LTGPVVARSLPDIFCGNGHENMSGTLNVCV
jgi:hypothetical protein